MEYDATNVLVVVGILSIVGAASWQFIGTFLVWALWQVVLFYVILIAVAAVLYLGLFVAVGKD